MAGKIPERTGDHGNVSVLRGRGLMSSWEQSSFPDLLWGVESVKVKLYLCRSEDKKLGPIIHAQVSKSSHRAEGQQREGDAHMEGCDH